MRFRLVGFYVVALWSALSSWLADAQQPIKLGMSAPFSGPAAQLGLQFRDGANLVFDRLNAQGGIDGNLIQLITADDGYEPLRTVENTRKFLLEQQVFALFGYIGTPTSSAILPLLRKHQRLYLTAFTGADILRQPGDTFIFNFRASYREEVAAQARFLIDQRQFRRVALLIQADEFGASVERWFLTELAQRQLQPVTVVRFQRNTTDMHNAVSQLKEATPDLVLTVGTYQPLVKAIQIGQQNRFNPVYSVVSFTGIQQLQQQLKQPYLVFASMVVPDPQDATSKFVKAYHHALKADNKQASDVGLEGFAAASILVSAFKSCAGNLTQTCLMQQLPQQRLYDFDLQYQPEAHQASHQVFLYQLTPLKLLKI
ncbi:MAG: ABC transporter substrate-binding protein [Rheinheimera sp.]|nr:ABC transporter substrate-binding protein [Rheinheimera sp.]